MKVKVIKFNGSTLNAWGLKNYLKKNGFVLNVKGKNKINTIQEIKNHQKIFQLGLYTFFTHITFPSICMLLIIIYISKCLPQVNA